jgi:hypothetical protein
MRDCAIGQHIHILPDTIVADIAKGAANEVPGIADVKTLDVIPLPSYGPAPGKKRATAVDLKASIAPDCNVCTMPRDLFDHVAVRLGERTNRKLVECSVSIVGVEA